MPLAPPCDFLYTQTHVPHVQIQMPSTTKISTTNQRQGKSGKQEEFAIPIEDEQHFLFNCKTINIMKYHNHCGYEIIYLYIFFI
jgi:hypothetical protein